MKKKVRSAAQVKRIQEEESAERMNRRAAEIEERNDLLDNGCKILEFPLRRSDGSLSGESVRDGRYIFRKK